MPEHEEEGSRAQRGQIQDTANGGQASRPVWSEYKARGLEEDKAESVGGAQMCKSLHANPRSIDVPAPNGGSSERQSTG